MFVVLKCFGVGNSFKFSFSRCFCARTSSGSITSEEHVKLKATRLSEALGCSVDTALVMIGKNSKILTLDDDDVERTTSFCKLNLKLSDVVEHPLIISLPHHVLNRRLHTLKELGYENVGGRNIIRFPRIIREMPKAAKISGSLPYTEDLLPKVLENFPPQQAVQIETKISQMYSENCSLSSIKAEINSQYIMWRLKCSPERLQKMLKKFPSLLLQSLENIDSALKVLTEEFGFTIAKINHSPFLLTLQATHLQHLLENVPTILEAPLQTLVKRDPAVLKKSSATLKKLEAILKDFGVTNKQLMCYPKVLVLTPKTLKFRLQTLHDSKDFVVVKTFRGFLGLIYHYKHLHSRLKLLNESGVPYSLCMFMVSEATFKKRILLSKGQTYAKDVAHYLSEIYNVSEKVIRKHLYRYPNIYCTSVMDSYKVINFLLGRGVSKEQLWNGLGIIAYKPDVVENVFNNLPCYKEFQPFSEWEGHFNLMQLLIYAIEKEQNYSSYSQLSTVTNIKNNKVVDDDTNECSNELLKEFEVDYISDSDVEDEDDDLSDSEEESQISDAYKM